MKCERGKKIQPAICRVEYGSNRVQEILRIGFDYLIFLRLIFFGKRLKQL